MDGGQEVGASGRVVRSRQDTAAIITALLEKELTKRQLLSASYVARTQDFDAYVNGIANKSAEQVAFIMCRMKYRRTR
jgi:hypothetical protein